MPDKKLIAIGEALIDFIPREKGCAFGEVTAFSPNLGGAPANVCGAFARLGGRAALLSQLGDDPFGDKILRELCECGIDISHISRTKKANTALAFVSLAADGNRTFSFYRNPSADMLLEPEQIDPAWFQDCALLHFCSVSLVDSPMRQSHKKALELAHENGCICSFDPNLRMELWDSREALYQTVWEFLPQADVLKISAEELEFLTGTKSIEEALPKLFQGHVQLILYTCGKDGAYVYTRKRSVHQAAKPVPVADTTGAGDGCAGSFLWRLSQTGVEKEKLGDLSEETLRDCLKFACAFCDLSVQKFGAIASYPGLLETEKMMEGH